MKLNLTVVATTIADYANADARLAEIYATENSRSDYEDLYWWDRQFIEASNEQTWDMVHFYESRHGLDYVENKLNWHIDEVPTYEEWFANYMNEIAAKGIIIY